MYHEIDEKGEDCKHCGKRHEEWSDHPNLRECPAFKTNDPFSLKATAIDDYDYVNVRDSVMYGTADVLEDDMKSYIAWEADPVTAFDQEAWEKTNANIVRGDN